MTAMAGQPTSIALLYTYLVRFPALTQKNMSVSFNQRVKLSDEVLISDLEGESVLLNLSSERYYGLDKVGTRFLTLLNNSESIQHAFNALLVEYDVEAETLRNDLTDLLLNLREQGLVEICE